MSAASMTNGSNVYRGEMRDYIEQEQDGLVFTRRIGCLDAPVCVPAGACEAVSYGYNKSFSAQVLTVRGAS